MRKLTDTTVLVIDDEEDILFTIKMLLKKHIGSVFTESNPFHLPRLIRQHQPDLILLDLNFRSSATTGEEGLNWLAKIKEVSPETQVIIITAHGDVEIAVRALKQGATDFIEKPWHNEKLLSTVRSTLELALSRREIGRLEQTRAALTDELQALTGQIVGRSEAMQSIFRTIEKVAKTDANVLILGENGTGKEMVARAIHQASPRRNEVFVKVDVGSIPESLIESELFGHKKGAFTDAREDRQGRFEAAQNGTLFLDEIGNLSLQAQSKFLSAIQNMAVTPVGSNRPVAVDFRLICATNESLSERVLERSFRQDLLYRINTVEIHVPPLRERIGDIPVLVGHFVGLFQEKYRKEDLAVAPEALRLLERHPWPGNVRELQHALERAIILSDSDLLLPEDFRFLGNEPELPEGDPASTLNIEEMERKLILQALQIHKGNISKAADDLGLTRAALYRRLDKFGLK
ncbi:MAG: sigma-54-dependent Fis family transcriptional regulator [Saprospiraceae bacterium]|nr:sigma-54-dependent Fis family transcriptional regulator [Saprospiraceae bacterium]